MDIISFVFINGGMNHTGQFVFLGVLSVSCLLSACNFSDENQKLFLPIESDSPPKKTYQGHGLHDAFCQLYSHLITCDDPGRGEQTRNRISRIINAEMGISGETNLSTLDVVQSQESDFRQMVYNIGFEHITGVFTDANLLVLRPQKQWLRDISACVTSDEIASKVIPNILEKMADNGRDSRVYIQRGNYFFDPGFQIHCHTVSPNCYDPDLDVYLVDFELRQYPASCPDGDVHHVRVFPQHPGEGYAFSLREPFSPTLSRTIYDTYFVNTIDTSVKGITTYQQSVSDRSGEKMQITEFPSIPVDFYIGDILYTGAINFSFENNWGENNSGISGVAHNDFSMYDDLGEKLMQRAKDTREFYRAYEIGFREYPGFTVYYTSELPIPLRLIWLGTDPSYLGEALNQNNILVDRDVIRTLLSYYTDADQQGSFEFLYNEQDHPDAYFLHDQITSEYMLSPGAFSAYRVTDDGYFFVTLNPPYNKRRMTEF